MRKFIETLVALGLLGFLGFIAYGAVQVIRAEGWLAGLIFVVAAFLFVGLAMGIASALGLFRARQGG